MGISLSLLLLAREEILEHKVFGSFDNGGDSHETKLEPSIKPNRKVIPKNPTIKLIEPIVFSSPRPVTELDSTATKLQKVYKGWKTLDFAALRRCSISFNEIEKQETVISKWSRAKTTAAKLGKGLSKDENAQKLALQHWLEAIDPRHRYVHNLHFYYDVWSASKSSQPFFYWLDIGDGKELSLKKCQRTSLQQRCINYLRPVSLIYGKLVYKQSGLLVNTIDDSKWIFVLSTSRSLYVGQKKKGVFQHSSFLSSGATTAAERLVVSQGVLEAIWPYSGHYLPTEDNFKEFIIFLEEQNVDLTNVKRCTVDDDYAACKVAVDESKHGEIKDPTTIVSLQSSIGNSAAKVEEPAFNMANRLSCKWSSGVGPQLGCVNDYPKELQSQALEQVNLSPRIEHGRFGNCGPIPSPRPSPKIRVSPRLAYMGLPIPRVSVMAAN
ncbi:hypothetical protein ES332_D08G095200v1 [Gossypium tomentosum]|uniref:Calmodulin-binding family protein n=1 Tax=Gossypium tomentosum TaxID=34277 RepID=A0A5D2JRR7_GOSTO|nr:hypothetical protein ES332_D08G095200v1 [Gossypium tomentosum]